MLSTPSETQQISEILWQSLEGEEVNLAELKTRLTEDSSFGDFGLDSLALVEFFLRLQSHFKISIRQEDYPHLTSLEAVQRYVQQKLLSPAS